jgi:hypothetical protein
MNAYYQAPKGHNVNNRGWSPRQIAPLSTVPEGGELKDRENNSHPGSGTNCTGSTPPGPCSLGVRIPWASPTVINIKPLRGYPNH